jgi:hypothetical protein
LNANVTSCCLVIGGERNWRSADIHAEPQLLRSFGEPALDADDVVELHELNAEG